MGEQSSMKPSANSKLAPEEDPKSELNVLRREVRHLQASMCDAALQLAAQQHQIRNLRSALLNAETEVDEALTREAQLRQQLHAQSVKRQRVESTLAAAEKLVSALREMVLESSLDAPPYPQPDDADPSSSAAPANPSCSTTQEKNLDVLLSRIEDLHSPPSPPSQPVQSAHVYQQLSTDNISPAEPSIPTVSAIEHKVMSKTTNKANRHSVAVTPQHPTPVESSKGVHQKDHVQPAAQVQSRAHRHSMPASRSPIISNAALIGQPSNLLKSAFGPGHPPPSPGKIPSIRLTAGSLESELPVPIDAIAKRDEVTRKLSNTSIALPSRINRANSQAHNGEIFALASSVDGKLIASGGDDKMIKVFDTFGNVIGSSAETLKSITALAFSAEVNQYTTDFDIICAGGTDGTVKRFRRNAKKKNKWILGTVFPVHTQAVRKMIFTDHRGIEGSGGLILSCSTDRTIKLSDVESGKRPFSISTPSAVLDVCCMPSFRNGLLISGHKDGGVRLWSTADTSACAAVGKVHTRGVVSLSALDDGNQVVSLGRDNAIRICDIRKNMSVVQEIEGAVETVSDWHRATVRQRHIMCGTGRGGKLGVWNLDTGKAVRKVSCEAPDSGGDVIDMVSRNLLRNPGCVVLPHWTNSRQLVCAHHSRQVSFWDIESSA